MFYVFTLLAEALVHIARDSNRFSVPTWNNFETSYLYRAVAEMPKSAN